MLTITMMMMMMQSAMILDHRPTATKENPPALDEERPIWVSFVGLALCGDAVSELRARAV